MVVPHSTEKPGRTMVRIPGNGSNFQADAVLCDLSKASSLAATISVPKVIPRQIQRLTQQSSKPSSDSSHQRGNVSSDACAEKLLDESARTELQEILPKTKSGDIETSMKRKRTDSENDSKNDNYQSNLTSLKMIRRDNATTPNAQIQLQTASLVYPTQSSQVLLAPPIQRQRVQMIPLQQSSLQPAQIAIQTSPIILLQGNPAMVSNSVLMHSDKTLQLGMLQQVSLAPEVPTNNIQHGHQNQCHVKELLQERDQLKKENQALADKLKRFQSVFKNKHNLQYLANRLAQTG